MLCISPISIPRPNGKGNQDRLEVPCGKCAACLTNRRNDWSTRLKIEHKYSTSAYFITLTYSEETVPYKEFVDFDTGEIRYSQTVIKKQLQDWFKRIRKYSQCRYYAVGEYGTHTSRPHYHVLLFNYNVNELYRLQSSWDYGFIQIGSVSDQSIMYVCKYHVNRTVFPPHSEPSFCLMSRRPGIGAVYAEKMLDYHSGYDRNYYPDQNGIKRRLPRYLKNKVYSEQEREHLTNHIEDKELSPQEWLDKKLDLIRQFKEKNNERQKL